MKAVIMDRDGTLIVDPNYDRVDAISKVNLLPKAIRGLSHLATNGFGIIIVTNQTSIAQGRITMEEFWHINDHVLDLLKPSLIEVFKTYVCPHDSGGNCACRKPKPLMLENAIEEFGLDRSHTYMVGDRLSDIEAGVNAGVETVMVKTGKQPTDMTMNANTYVAEHLLDAAKHIVDH